MASIKLTWSHPTYDIPNEGYIIGYRQQGSSDPYIEVFVTSGTELIIDDLLPDTTYEGYIKSNNGGGNISGGVSWIHNCERDCNLGVSFIEKTPPLPPTATPTPTATINPTFAPTPTPSPTPTETSLNCYIYTVSHDQSINGTKFSCYTYVKCDDGLTYNFCVSDQNAFGYPPTYDVCAVENTIQNITDGTNIITTGTTCIVAPTPTPTPTISPTPTSTPSPTPTNTGTPTPTPTTTDILPTPTSTIDNGLNPTPTSTSDESNPTPTPTSTSDESNPTPTPTSTIDNGLNPTPTSTTDETSPTPTPTSTTDETSPTPTPTSTTDGTGPTPTSTSDETSPTPTPTSTSDETSPTPTPTSTSDESNPTPTPTSTIDNGLNPTPTPTSTSDESNPTPTPTSTTDETDQPTPTATEEPTPTPTETEETTPTPTPTSTPNPTPVPLQPTSVIISEDNISYVTASNVNPSTYPQKDVEYEGWSWLNMESGYEVSNTKNWEIYDSNLNLLSGTNIEVGYRIRQVPLNQNYYQTPGGIYYSFVWTDGNNVTYLIGVSGVSETFTYYGNPYTVTSLDVTSKTLMSDLTLPSGYTFYPNFFGPVGDGQPWPPANERLGRVQPYDYPEIQNSDSSLGNYTTVADGDQGTTDICIFATHPKPQLNTVIPSLSPSNTISFITNFTNGSDSSLLVDQYYRVHIYHTEYEGVNSADAISHASTTLIGTTNDDQISSGGILSASGVGRTVTFTPSTTINLTNKRLVFRYELYQLDNGNSYENYNDYTSNIHIRAGKRVSATNNTLTRITISGDIITPTPGPTSTPLPTATDTPTPTPTSTNEPTPTATETPVPTSTETPTPTPTSTNEPTPTATETPTPTPTLNEISIQGCLEFDYTSNILQSSNHILAGLNNEDISGYESLITYASSGQGPTTNTTTYENWPSPYSNSLPDGILHDVVFNVGGVEYTAVYEYEAGANGPTAIPHGKFRTNGYTFDYQYVFQFSRTDINGDDFNNIFANFDVSSDSVKVTPRQDCNPNPTSTPTPTSTETPTPTPTSTETPTPTPTSTNEPTPTATDIQPTPTPTPTGDIVGVGPFPTATPFATPQPTQYFGPTPTPTPTATSIDIDSIGGYPTPTPTQTPFPTMYPTPTPTNQGDTIPLTCRLVVMGSSEEDESLCNLVIDASYSEPLPTPTPTENNCTLSLIASSENLDCDLSIIGNYSNLPTTYEYYLVNVSTNHYEVFDDELGTTSFGYDPEITIKVGDTLNMTNLSGGHPLYFKTIASTGTGDQVTGATGQGATNGTVSWTPTVSGTYYYQCSAHINMSGIITVTN